MRYCDGCPVFNVNKKNKTPAETPTMDKPPQLSEKVQRETSLFRHWLTCETEGSRQKEERVHFRGQGGREAKGQQQEEKVQKRSVWLHTVPHSSPDGRDKPICVPGVTEASSFALAM